MKLFKKFLALHFLIYIVNSYNNYFSSEMYQIPNFEHYQILL